MIWLMDPGVVAPTLAVVLLLVSVWLIVIGYGEKRTPRRRAALASALLSGALFMLTIIWTIASKQRRMDQQDERIEQEVNARHRPHSGGQRRSAARVSRLTSGKRPLPGKLQLQAG